LLHETPHILQEWLLHVHLNIHMLNTYDYSLKILGWLNKLVKRYTTAMMSSVFYYYIFQTKGLVEYIIKFYGDFILSLVLRIVH
jgi:hypothetical protein